MARPIETYRGARRMSWKRINDERPTGARRASWQDVNRLVAQAFQDQRAQSDRGARRRAVK